jgi:hypothetical protein
MCFFKQAYQTWLMNNKETTLPGLKYTNEQLFYISFAQVLHNLNITVFCLSVYFQNILHSYLFSRIFQAYCSNSRPTQDYLATLTDPHSDETFR